MYSSPKKIYRHFLMYYSEQFLLIITSCLTGFVFLQECCGIFHTTKLEQHHIYPHILEKQVLHKSDF